MNYWLLGLQFIFLCIVAGFFLEVGMWVSRAGLNRISIWYWNKYTRPKMVRSAWFDGEQEECASSSSD